MCLAFADKNKELALGTVAFILLRVNHQPEFTAYCITPDADKALIDGALAMAWTCIDLATHPTLRGCLLTRH